MDRRNNPCLCSAKERVFLQSYAFALAGRWDANGLSHFPGRELLRQGDPLSRKLARSISLSALADAAVHAASPAQRSTPGSAATRHWALLSMLQAVPVDHASVAKVAVRSTEE
jgi:hypothetical protein